MPVWLKHKWVRSSYIIEKIPHVEDKLAETGYECARSESWENSDICLVLLQISTICYYSKNTAEDIQSTYTGRPPPPAWL